MKFRLIRIALACSCVIAAFAVSICAGAVALQPATNEQVAHDLCRNAVAAIAERQGINLSVTEVSDILERPATWEEFRGIEHPDVRAARDELVAGDASYAWLDAGFERDFARRDWTTYRVIVTLAQPFRSEATRTNGVMCSFVAEANVPLHEADLDPAQVRINGASANDHVLRRLPL